MLKLNFSGTTKFEETQKNWEGLCLPNAPRGCGIGI